MPAARRVSRGDIIRRYALALAATAVAALLRLSLPGVLADTPSLAFGVAVFIAAAFGGLGPGLVATIGSALCVNVLFTPPYGQLTIPHPAQMVRIAIFLAAGIGVSLLAEMQRRGRTRERRQSQALRESIDDVMRARRESDERLRFEMMLADTSAALIASPPDQLESQIEGALERAADLLGVDRVSLGEISADRQHLCVVQSCCRRGPPLSGEIPAGKLFPWSWHETTEGRAISFSKLADLPPEAAVDRENYAKLGTSSAVMIPLFRLAGSVDYAISIGALGQERAWPEAVIARLRLFGEVLANVVARDRARTELWLSEQRFAAFMDHLPGTAWMKDLQGRYVYGNPETTRVWSRALPEILAKTDEEIFPPETARQFREHDRRALSEGNIETTETQRQADGTDRHELVHKFTVPGPDGQPAWVGGAAFDITRRVEAEEEVCRLNADLEQRVRDRTESLRRSEEFSRRLIESSPDCIKVLDLEGRLLTINKGGQQLVEAPDLQTLVNSPWVEWWQGAGRTEAIQAVADARAGQTRRFQSLSPTFAGTPKWWDVWVSPILGADGQPERLLSLARDITELKESEQELQQREAQLQEANQQLESFAYSVSHDLRAPLRAITGFSRIVMEDYAAQLAPEIVRHLRIIDENTRHMGCLIDDLLTFSRLSRQPLSKQQVSMERLVAEVVDEVRAAETASRPVEVRVGELPSCQADPGLLRQVWVNLISNAFKYTRRCEAAIIDIGCSRDTVTEEPVYFIKDNGTGFDMQYADKLFGVFQRLHRAEEYEGTGVGLAIVQRVVQRHGGRVWAEAQVGKGATFFFTLEGSCDGRDGR